MLSQVGFNPSKGNYKIVDPTCLKINKIMSDHFDIIFFFNESSRYYFSIFTSDLIFHDHITSDQVKSSGIRDIESRINTFSYK